ncbi:MAG TPA: DUF2062 domain-containing protein [Thermoanaerobaculia bacterium]|nr:DUF2062 domain-containing protein [Thermoanaerobaculia bacterium]
MAQPEPLPRKTSWKIRLRELLYRLRIEGDSPARQAGAVALGVFIGCTPLYGFHLPLCLVFARLLGVNRLKTYIAAHISTPVVAPFLIFAEIQAGRRLRGAPPLSIRPSRFRKDFQDYAIWHWHFWHWRSWSDLVVGSIVLGILLAALFGLLTFWLLRRGRRTPQVESLIEETAHRYVDEAGLIQSELVRGKLRHDPVYFSLLQNGDLPASGRLLDLGCGRGIVLAMLAAARKRQALGDYPADWAPPPVLELRGIEESARVAEVARRVLDGEATIETADLRAAVLPPADVVVMIDVLHYLGSREQEELLARVATALAPGGSLLLREADAGAGYRFLAIRVSERLSEALRGRWRRRLSYRSAAGWMRLLTSLGFAAEVAPMGMGTPYANVLIRARRAARPPLLPA